MIRSSFDISSNIVLSCLVLSCLVILPFYMIEKVYNVVGLPKIVLNVVIFGGYAELDKLVFECSALLEKAMNFSLDFHLVGLCCLYKILDG